jgi:hypothetical protein
MYEIITLCGKRPVILLGLYARNMINSTAKLKIEKLQQQLDELKEIYQDRIRNAKEPRFLKQIEKQIQELERVIGQALTDQ